MNCTTLTPPAGAAHPTRPPPFQNTGPPASSWQEFQSYWARHTRPRQPLPGRHNIPALTGTIRQWTQHVCCNRATGSGAAQSSAVAAPGVPFVTNPVLPQTP